MNWEGQERPERCWRGRLQLRDVFARCKHVGKARACCSPGPSEQQTTQAVGQPSFLLTWASATLHLGVGKTSEGRAKPGAPASAVLPRQLAFASVC